MKTNSQRNVLVLVDLWLHQCISSVLPSQSYDWYKSKHSAKKLNQGWSLTHLLIFCCLYRAGSQGQQSMQLSSQLIWGNTKVFLSRPRDVTSAIWPVFTPGSPPSRTRLETSTRRHPEGTGAWTALTVSTSTWRNQQARFYFSSAFSTTRLVLLGDKLAAMQVDTSLATWIADYLTGRWYTCLTSHYHGFKLLHRDLPPLL